MKYGLFILCVLLLITSAAGAQSDEVSVVQRFSVEVPASYVFNYTYPSWSPDGTLLALSFDKLDASRSPVERLWQIYDVATGDLLHEHAFVGDAMFSSDTAFIWYADSSRLLIRDRADASPRIVDARTGSTLFMLENAGLDFAEEPISDVIINRDDEPVIHTDPQTLRIYDAQTGALRFMRENVSGLLVYSPDKTQFVITVAGTRVELYSVADFELIDAVDGFWINPNDAVWHSDGRQLLVIQDNPAPWWYQPYHIWTLGEGLSAPIYNVTGNISWSPDGSQIVAPSDYTKLRFYDSHTGELQETLRGFANDPIVSVSWKEHYLAGIYMDYLDAWYSVPRLLVWDSERGEVVYECDDIPWFVGLNYHIENDMLEIWGYLISLRRVDLTTGEVLFEGVNKSLSLSPDRQWYLVNNTHFDEGVPVPIDVYETESQTLIASLSGHTEIVNFYWSPDSRHFASVGGPGIVIVWEVQYSD